MSDSVRLMVPIRIDALLVGANQPHKDFQWTNLTPDFFLLGEPKNDYLLGSHPDLNRMFQEATGKFMPPGVHLHFRLPRALTHGEEGPGKIEFPRIPNRWLVQRTYRDATKTLKHRAWLIKSDAKAAKPWSRDNPGVTWPEFPVGQPAVFRSIGLCLPLNGPIIDTDEKDDPEAPTLTAIGWGDPTFAASYASCRSVLGFYDELDDGPYGTELSYLVTGWYSKAVDDLLHAFVERYRKEKVPSGAFSAAQRKKLFAQMEAELRWGCEASAKSEPPTRLICYGLVRDVGLRKGKTDLQSSPFNLQVFSDVHRREGNYHIAIGEAPGEALAALLAPGEVDQDLLTALQAGLLTQDTTVSDLRYQLHARRFAGVHGGTVFQIQPESEAFLTPNDQPPQRANAGVLPEPLRDSLQKLNLAQAAFDRQERRVDDCLWQHHACWILWMSQSKRRGSGSKDARDRQAQFDSFAKLLAAEKTILEKDRSARDELSTAIESTLKKDYQRMLATGGTGPMYRLTGSALPAFESPNDPIIAIDGPAMQRLGPRSESDGETGAAEGTKYVLPCRLSSAIANSFEWKQFFGADATSPGGVHCDLLLEFLSSQSNQSGESPSTSSGRPPVAADDDWVNPWIPLFLIWEVQWQSDYPNDGVIVPDFISNRWTLARAPDADGEPDLAHKSDAVRLAPGGKISGTDTADWVSYRGRSILTPTAAASLARALQELEVDALVPALQSRHVMSQSLDGFQEALMRRQVGTRLPALEFKSKEVLQDPLTFGTFPTEFPTERATPGRLFFPLRAGRLRIEKLNVVDAFGQTVKLPVADIISRGNLHRSHNTVIANLDPSLKKNEIKLRPRFVTPMRLRFDLENAGAVCGWVLPNHMEQSLGIYSASGKPLGAFQKRFKPQACDQAYYWVPFPGEAEKGHQRGDEALNTWLRDGGADDLELREALYVFWQWVGSLDPDQGSAFSNLLDESIQATDQRVPEEDPGISVLVGRPLALVRASLRLESPGLPAHSPELVPEFPAMLKHPPQATAIEEATVTREFQKVRWPIRVGDLRLRNDGVVGVFRCSSSGKPEGPFYPTWGGDEVKQRKEGKWAEVEQRKNSKWERCGFHQWEDKFGIQDDFQMDCEAPFRVMMLMDPQARAHAAIGALPRVHLALPEVISSGAKRIRDVFFQTAPVLGESDTPHMPRPSDDYGEWSWAWRPDVTTWKEDPALIEATDRGGFSGTWPAIAEGWLKLRTAPVKVLSFWVREGNQALDNTPPCSIHLAWSLQSAETLKLERSDDDGKTFIEEKKWDKAPLPLEYLVNIAGAVTYRLTATAEADVQPSWKEIKIGSKELS